MTKQLAPHLSPWLTRCLIALVTLNCLLAVAQTSLWQEEFTNGIAPDPATWSYEIGDGCSIGICNWGNQELQYYTDRPENVYVTNGQLHIVAQAESPAYNGYAFTSARIKTQDKLTFKYGTVEARIKIPDLGNGLWPAFWTLGNDWNQGTPWPNCGEIDVMEMGNGNAISAGVVNRRVSSATHWDNNGSYNLDYDSVDAPSTLNGSFHILRLEWTPSTIRTYLDGSLIYTFDISNPSSSREEFHLPHFLILNLAVGGNYTGITNPNQISAPLPAEYVIDWIRIYDNGSTVLGGSSLGPPEPPEPPPVTGTNLLANPGFESGTTGWTLNDWGGTVGDSTVYANSGSRSLLADSAGAGQWSSPQALQTFAAEPGDVFNFKGYMRTPSTITDGSFGLLKIVFRDATGNDLIPASVDLGVLNNGDYPGVESAPFLDSQSPANQWIPTEAQGEAPAGTAQVLFFLLNVNQNPNAMYFDDIEASLLGGPVVPVELSAALVGDNIEISFPTQNGVNYDVVYRNSLTDPSWQFIETISGDGSTNTVSYPASTPARAYAVQIP